MSRLLRLLILCLLLAGCGAPSQGAGVAGTATTSATTALQTAPTATRPAPTATEAAAPTNTATPTHTASAPPATEPPVPSATASAQGVPAEPGWELQPVEPGAPLARGQATSLMAQGQPIGEVLVEQSGLYTLTISGFEPLSGTLRMPTLETPWQELALVRWPGGERALLVVEDWGNTAWWRTLHLFDFATASRFAVDLYFEKELNPPRRPTGRVAYTLEDRLDEPGYMRQRAFLSWIMRDYGDVNTHWSGHARRPELRDAIAFIPGQTFVDVGAELATRFPFREHGERAGMILLGDTAAQRGDCEMLGRSGDIVIERPGATPVTIRDAWRDGCLSELRREAIDEVSEDITFLLSKRGQTLDCALNPREVLVVCRDLKSRELSYIPADQATPQRLARLKAEHDWLARFD